MGKRMEIVYTIYTYPVSEAMGGGKVLAGFFFGETRGISGGFGPHCPFSCVLNAVNGTPKGASSYSDCTKFGVLSSPRNALVTFGGSPDAAVLRK